MEFPFNTQYTHSFDGYKTTHLSSLTIMLSPSSALVQFVDPRALRTCSLVLMVALYAEYMCLGDMILSRGSAVDKHMTQERYVLSGWSRLSTIYAQFRGHVHTHASI